MFPSHSPQRGSDNATIDSHIAPLAEIRSSQREPSVKSCLFCRHKRAHQAKMSERRFLAFASFFPLCCLAFSFLVTSFLFLISLTLSLSAILLSKGSIHVPFGGCRPLVHSCSLLARSGSLVTRPLSSSYRNCIRLPDRDPCLCTHLRQACTMYATSLSDCYEQRADGNRPKTIESIEVLKRMAWCSTRGAACRLH